MYNACVSDCKVWRAPYACVSLPRVEIRGRPDQSFREVLRDAIGDDPARKAEVAKKLGMTAEGVHMALHRTRRTGGTAGMDEDTLRRIAAAAELEVMLVVRAKKARKR